MKRSTLLITGSLLLVLASLALGAQRASGSWVAFRERVSEQFVRPARAADIDPPPTTHAVFTKLLQKAGIDNPNGEITSDSIFHTSNHNLYSYVYQQIFDKPEKDAILELSQAYGLTPTDAEIVVSGAYTPLLRGRGPAYGQDRAVQDMQKIQQSYARILQYRQLGYKLNATIASTEIFANGSLDDSSFDLIHDLDVIEQLLFVDQTKVQIGQKMFKNPTSKNSDLGTSSAALTAGAGPTGSAVSSGGSSGTSGSGSGSGSSGPAPGNSGKPASIDDVMKGLVASSKSTINQCDKDSPINKAVDTYDKDHGTGSTTVSTGNGGTSDGTSSGDLSASLLPPVASKILAPELSPITTTAAAPITVPKTDLCADITNNPSPTDPPPKDAQISTSMIYMYPPEPNAQHVFCVSLDTRTRTYTSFTPSGQSCIQCTVAAMNETMKKLLSKSLAPNKLTGNAYESSKCKAVNLSSLFDMNLFLIPVPITTPQKLGPLVGHDIGKEWDRFVKNSLPFGKTLGASSQRIVDEAAQNVGAGATQQQLLAEITSGVQQEIAAAQRRLANRPTSTQTDIKAEGYQQVIAEMRLMTSYFASFQQTLTHFNEDSCKTLLDKPNING